MEKTLFGLTQLHCEIVGLIGDHVVWHSGAFFQVRSLFVEQPRVSRTGLAFGGERLPKSNHLVPRGLAPQYQRRRVVVMTSTQASDVAMIIAPRDKAFRLDSCLCWHRCATLY